jgi:Protein of unknown function (DUF1367)
MKLWLVKLPTGDLRPLDEMSLKRLGVGEALEFEYKLSRNYKFLQKFFVFIKAVYDIEAIQNEFSSPEHLRAALTIQAGYFEIVIGFDNKPFVIPKSISFAKMDEAEFDQFYAKIMKVVLDKLPDYVENDIFEMENHIMSFA